MWPGYGRGTGPAFELAPLMRMRHATAAIQIPMKNHGKVALDAIDQFMNVALGE